MTLPHSNAAVLRRGDPVDKARAAMILVHGRGSSAADILELERELAYPGFAYLAPQADNNSWYPKSFLVPRQDNQPWIDGALAVIDRAVDDIGSHGLGPDRIILLGFSQGACLVLEYAARKPRLYGGVVGLSGGLIGQEIHEEDYAGDLAGGVVFLGCSDTDGHIPKERVQTSAEILRKRGGEVVLTLYPGIGHMIIEDEILFVRKLMRAVALS